MVADAPHIVTDRPCYSAVTPLRLSGTGFTPGAPLTVSGTWLNGSGRPQIGPVFHLSADASGAFAQTQDVPQIADLSDLYQIAVDDQAAVAAGAPGPSAVTFAQVSAFGAFYGPWDTDGPARARPGRAARVYAAGFIGAGHYLYLHYVRNGEAVKTVRVGRLHGPCGTLTARIREFAFRPRPAGTYNPRFDTSRQWPNDTPWSAYARVVLRPRDAVGRARVTRRSAGRP
jgi:hypothetical protein